MARHDSPRTLDISSPATPALELLESKPHAAMSIQADYPCFTIFRRV